MPSDVLKDLQFPVTASDLLRKRLSLKRALLAQPNLISTRIAILGGSTTTEVRNMLELFLLAQGVRADFYESGYNRYSEDVLFENEDLRNFRPELVLIHTTWRNVSQFPKLMEPEAEVEERVQREVARFVSLWERIQSKLGALIIQNNFDLPIPRPLGNLEASESYGRVHFLMRLNAEFAAYARQHPQLLINDIHYLSAKLGSRRMAWAHLLVQLSYGREPVGNRRLDSKPCCTCEISPTGNQRNVLSWTLTTRFGEESSAMMVRRI